MKKIIFLELANNCAKFFLITLLTISVIIWVLQSVNYLDYVVEDGHGFLVYFNYTIFSFPKIFSRIFPFAIFLAFSYIFLKYEDKNELVIFWNFGIQKINFIKFFIKYSLFFVFLSLLLNSIIVPYTQDKARSFIRSSDLDFFGSILKPKKFIDIVENLTIYFDEESKNGTMKNVLIKENIKKNNSRMIFAKLGVFEKRGNKKVLVLYDGTTTNFLNGKLSEFQFSKTDFNITNFSSRTVKQKKIQENSTKELIECLFAIKELKKNLTITNCTPQGLENIYIELYKRLIKPLYITFLITISLLFILKSKTDPLFRSEKIKIYSLGFMSILFIESSSKFINLNLIQNFILSIMPIILVFFTYWYFLKRLKIQKK